MGVGKGHSGNKYNDIADKLAVDAINELKNNLNELSSWLDGSIKIIECFTRKRNCIWSALVSGKSSCRKRKLLKL